MSNWNQSNCVYAYGLNNYLSTYKIIIENNKTITCTNNFLSEQPELYYSIKTDFRNFDKIYFNRII
jgi:hypothetical protein